ncbi:hypothetical protein PRIPAC_91054 [Pristionchus pacificus]|uniref:Uncharacterized protein n=1 Tax=Pristionchus pacificus TaxID=54126 RepID=A0A2A6B9E0_PRIPA|nr:hypothetical protein PRIPAC_91054 [Pristionchus pacificus]|eukprot:PDM62488.1 hypothetical protein PRIPAC_51930 [Pristionchus pacificus]
MSEEQSDFPGPLNVDTDKLEVTYNPSMPESSFSPLSSGSNSSQALLMLSRTDDETPSKPTLRAAQNRHLDTGVCLESHSRMSKRIACCLCGVLLFAFGVYGGIFYYIFSSSSSYPITTYAPRAPIAPMAPAAPASPMEPPRPIGPVDPICHPSNIPGTFYNQRGTLLPALRQCSMSKRIACCLCGVLLFAFGVYGGIFYYIFSSSSSYPITTYAPRAPIAPMAPAAPASPMEPPRPIGPVDPICHPSNIPGTFYNQRGTLLPALRQCSPFQRRSDDAIGESDGGWSVGQRESVKIACGRSIGRITRISEDAYKKYSIEYALALARGTNGNYVNCFFIRKVNDPLPRVALDCDQAVYTDSSTDVDRARSSLQKGSFTTLSKSMHRYLVRRHECRVLLFALVFGEFKSVILEVANHTAGRENRVTTEREGTLRDSGTQRKEPKKKSLLKVDSSPMKVDSSPLDVDSSPAKYENYTPTGSFDERETAPTMRPREVSIALTLQLDAHQPGGSIDDAMSSWLMDNGGISNKYCNDNRSMDV